MDINDDTIHHPLVDTSNSGGGIVVITAAGSGAGVSYQMSTSRSTPHVLAENAKNGGAGLQVVATVK